MGLSGMRTAWLGVGLGAWLAPVTILAGMQGLVAPAAAAPQDAAYTIGNYPVDATAQDAVRAKDKALADGQQAAFRSLLKRIVPVTAYQRLKRLPQVKAADLIDGVAVRSERNSSTQYIANLDFSFQPQAVRNLLRREGVPFIDAQAPKTVVVPVLRDTGGAYLADKSWTDAWSGLDLEHSVSPVALGGWTGAITPETMKAALSGDAAAGGALAAEFKSDRVVLAIAEIDKGAKKLNVVLTGNDAVGSFALKRSLRLHGDTGYAMELSAVIGLGVLEGRWKAVQADARGGVATIAGPGELIQLQVEFATLAQWNEMRRQLEATAGVEDVEIGTISARSADVSLRFPGGPERLADALAAQRLSLRNAGGLWSLRPSF